MKLASLTSGGKDSIYSIYKAQQNGHTTECLITLLPSSKESMMLHHPNIKMTKLQSLSMNIPQIYRKSQSDNIDIEMNLIKNAIHDAMKSFNIDGLVNGCISSKFQIDKLSKICNELNIESYSPLKESDDQYLYSLIQHGFRFVIVDVSADGLNGSWLGKEIIINDMNSLLHLSKKFGFNINFDGGEAETFVIDCPLFKHPIKINYGKKYWDGYRGTFDIQEAELDYNVR
ncbi:MAG: diphthine--ammonia ligase [Thaumarchaeota archaeon]|nr:diphthine--ammonia ligase [Nitrososphaerota archaeon]MCY3976273.1 diphthine--ammonia ligase [Nitrososphaerota archaeon]